MPMGRNMCKHLMLFSVYGKWVRASNGQLPPNATQFNDEYGTFYVARATVQLFVHATGPYKGRKAPLTLPARLEESEAIVTYDSQVLRTPDYEVSLCTYISVETEAIERFDEFFK